MDESTALLQRHIYALLGLAVLAIAHTPLSTSEVRTVRNNVLYALVSTVSWIAMTRGHHTLAGGALALQAAVSFIDMRAVQELVMDNAGPANANRDR